MYQNIKVFYLPLFIPPILFSRWFDMRSRSCLPRLIPIFSMFVIVSSSLFNF